MYTVYQHLNKITNKSYIGITGQEPERRWSNNGYGYLHKNKNGNFIQTKFANAILEYGWDSFEHIILKENLTLEEASTLEIEYIKKFDTYNNGYNSNHGGLSFDRVNSSNNRDLNGYKNPKAVPVIGFNNNFYKFFFSAADARRETKCQNISSCIKGERKYTNYNNEKIQWRYATDEEIITNYKRIHPRITEKHLNQLLESFHSKQQKHISENCKNIISKKVDKYSKDGIYIQTYSSAKEAGELNNCNICQITAVCRKRNKTCGGFIWKYTSERKDD